MLCVSVLRISVAYYEYNGNNDNFIYIASLKTDRAKAGYPEDKLTTESQKDQTTTGLNSRRQKR